MPDPKIGFPIPTLRSGVGERSFQTWFLWLVFDQGAQFFPGSGGLVPNQAVTQGLWVWRFQRIEGPGLKIFSCMMWGFRSFRVTYRYVLAVTWGYLGIKSGSQQFVGSSGESFHANNCAPMETAPFAIIPICGWSLQSTTRFPSGLLTTVLLICF